MNERQVFVIAEAGVNHNADLKMAVELIHSAKRCGADCVKFQTAVPELVVTRSAKKADYQMEATGKSESQLEMLKKLVLPLDVFKELKKVCEEVGILFLSTPFDLVSIDALHDLKMELWKIPSGEITNLPYLRKIGSYGGDVILSTGMSSLGDIESALSALTNAGTSLSRISLLHCNTEYPTPFADVNLRAMITLKQAFGVRVGYSDHTKGIEVPIAAVAMGAMIIEKHFTLDKNLPGPDHKASLEPDELAKMIESIRNIEQALGTGIKAATESEKKNMLAARKSLVAKTKILKGTPFSSENLSVKRPGNGISPMLWDSIVGKQAKRDFDEEELIEL